MAKKGRNLMGGRNPKRKKAIDEAVGSAMDMPMKRPKARPATGQGAPDFKPNQHSYGSKENVDYVWDTDRVFNNLYKDADDEDEE